MAERNDHTSKTPTNTAGADKNPTANPTTEAHRTAGKDRELDREGQQPIGKAHTQADAKHGQDDRHQVTNTPREDNADRQRTDGPASSTEERFLTGGKKAATDAASHGTDPAGSDKRVGGDAARIVAGDDARKATKDHTEQPAAGTPAKAKH